jgi:hypothetical protein
MAHRQACRHVAGSVGGSAQRHFDAKMGVVLVPFGIRRGLTATVSAETSGKEHAEQPQGTSKLHTSNNTFTVYTFQINVTGKTLLTSYEADRLYDAGQSCHRH